MSRNIQHAQQGENETNLERPRPLLGRFFLPSSFFFFFNENRNEQIRTFFLNKRFSRIRVLIEKTRVLVHENIELDPINTG